MICAWASESVEPSSFLPIIGVMPIMACNCACVLPGKTVAICVAAARKVTIAPCATVGGTIMVLMLFKPKSMVIKLTMSILTPAATVVLSKFMESTLKPLNQPGRVKDT